MATRAKKAPGLTRLNLFANSPLFVRLFGPILLILMLLAAGYGGYTLVRQQLSSASSNDKNTWYYNSKATGHHAGQAGGYSVLADNTDQKGPKKKKGPVRAVWVASSPLDSNKLVWWGPYKSLQTDRQYIGCFFYAFSNSLGSATIDVANNGGATIIRQYTISGSNPRQSGTFNRTCLAFYVPKSMKNNGIELRFKYLSGTLNIRKTKISKVTGTNNELYNQYMLKKGPDNNTVISGYGYTL